MTTTTAAAAASTTTQKTNKVRSLIVQAPRRNGFVDLTDPLQDAIDASGVEEGFAIAFTAHTTCALVVNEWEEGIQADFVKAIERLVPQDEYFAHDDHSVRTQNLTAEERVNGASHIAGLLVGNTSQVVPVAGGRPAYGKWQRLIMIDLDEPKPRSIFFVIASL